MFQPNDPPGEMAILRRICGDGKCGRMQKAQEVKHEPPSGARQATTGWKSCNGWTFWQYRQPVTGELPVIDELRGQQ